MLLPEVWHLQLAVEQQLVTHAKSCVQPGLDYSQHQLQTNLKVPLAAFKAAHFFRLPIWLVLKGLIRQSTTLSCGSSTTLLPEWTVADKKALAAQPSFAVVEQAFSLLNSTFGDNRTTP